MTRLGMSVSFVLPGGAAASRATRDGGGERQLFGSISIFLDLPMHLLLMGTPVKRFELKDANYKPKPSKPHQP